MQVSPNTTPPTTASSSPNHSQNGTSPSRPRALSLTNGRTVSASPPHSHPLSFLVPKSLFAYPQSATAAAASDLAPLESSLSELSISPKFQLEEPFLAMLTREQLLTMSPLELMQIFNSAEKVLDASSSSRSFADAARAKLPLIQKALCDRELIDKICSRDQTVWSHLSLACQAIIQPQELFEVISQCCTGQTRQTLVDFCQFWIQENSATLWLEQAQSACADFFAKAQLQITKAGKTASTEQAVLSSSNKIDVAQTLTEICTGRTKPSTHAKETASDLTAQQVSFYLRISEHDLMPGKYKTRSAIFQEWKDHFNKLTDFVIDTILFTPCVSKGSEQLNRLAHFFVEVGIYSLDAGDFMTARALLAALDDANVLRLLSQDLKESDSYRKLNKLSDMNFLRASPQSVPLLALLEGDLTRLSEMQAVITESDGRMHYNYHKLLQTHSLITTFLTAQRTWKAPPTPTTTIIADYLRHGPKNTDLRRICSDKWRPPANLHFLVV